MNKGLKFKTIVRQLISFFGVGIISFIIDFAFYNIYSFFFPINTSKGMSYIMGFLNSYLMNKKITFQSNEKGYREPLNFTLLYLFTLFINYFSHKYLIEIASGYWPFIGATAASVIINFIGLKVIVFKK